MRHIENPFKRNAYLLITLYRSGSTLTGEMFNRNLDFLYFFEPLGKVEHHSFRTNFGENSKNPEKNPEK